jgi:iron complex outermembrane receptor protein
VTTVTGQTVTTAGVDVDNPTALPLIRTIVASYTNADSEVASGVDLTGTARYDLGHGLRFTSSFNGAWLTKLALTDGVEYRYDGSLGLAGRPRARARRTSVRTGRTRWKSTASTA